MRLTFNSNALPRAKSVVDQLDEIIAQCEATQFVNQEGFGANLLASVKDIFGTLKSTIADNVLALFTDMKRGELQHFMDRNGAKVRLLDEKSFDQVMDCTVFYPHGMNTTYVDAVTKLQEFYKSVKILNVSSLLKDQTDRLYREMSRGADIVAQKNIMAELLRTMVDGKTLSAKTEALLIATTDKEAKSEDQLDKLILGLTKDGFKSLERQAKSNEVFTDTKNSVEKGTFKDAFSSMREFATVRQSLLAEEKQLQTAVTLHKDIEYVDNTLGSIIDMLEKKNDDPQFVASFAKVVRMMAVMVNQYSFAVYTQMALEHNYILTTLQALKTV